jgi:hypothetical protein
MSLEHELGACNLKHNVILIHLHGRMCLWMNFIYELDLINKSFDEIHP